MSRFTNHGVPLTVSYKYTYNLIQKVTIEQKKNQKPKYNMQFKF